MSERWLPIAGFEDSYQISDRGRVRSLDRHRLNGKGGQILWRGRVIKPYLQRRTGHVLYNLWRNCAQTKVQAHRLVLETFVGPGPLGHECCHRDGNPQNNWVEARHRFQVLADMKNATTRVQEQLGGTA